MLAVMIACRWTVGSAALVQGRVAVWRRTLLGVVAVGGGGEREGGVVAVAMRSSVVCRRRLRCLGGRPHAARLSLSAWPAAKASATRRLRATRTVAANSVIGVRPVSRHQPRVRL